MGKKKIGPLTWLGIITLGGILGGGGTLLLFDINAANHAKMGEGLSLFVPGVHIGKGEHYVVATDQFYKVVSAGTPEETQKFIFDSLKYTYNHFNKYNSCVSFTFCTTSDEVATKFGVKKIEKYGKGDIPLYATEDIISNNNYVMAKTDWKYNILSYEMEDLSITFRKKYLEAVWKEYPTLEETLNPHNSAVYTIAIHETMHTMGFAHVDGCESIMNAYVSSKSPKDLTNYDIAVLDKYNVQFYGAIPTYTEPELKTYTANKIKLNENAKDMSI